MADIEYKSTLDNSDVLKKLKRQEKRIEDAAKKAERSFAKAGKAAEQSAGGFKKFGDSAVTRMNQAVQLVGQLGGAIQGAFQLIEEAVSGTRIETAFQQLAANAGQSGDDILTAINKASNGTISRLDAMRSANTALQFGVAKTPEEFEKMTKGAIALGRALGVSTNKALEDFTLGAGRGSVLILDNLGISAKQLKDEMNRLAQDGFGKTTEQLDAAEKQAIFTEASLSVLNNKASELGTNMKDVGAGVDQAKADFANFRLEFGKTLAILTSSTLGGDGGFFARLTEGAKAWQFITLDAIALIAGSFDGLKAVAAQTFEPILVVARQLKGVFETGSFEGIDFGEASRAQALARDPGAVAKTFKDTLSESFRTRRDSLGERFDDFIDPKAVKVAGIEAGEALAEGVDEGAESSDELAKATEKVTAATDKLNKAREQGNLDLQIKQERRLTDELLDNARAREDLARDNAEAIADIQREGLQDIADEAKELSNEQAEIAKDGARRQAEIARSEADERVGIERDYRRQLERIRDDFNQSALDAERANDVQAFLQAQRTRDSAVDEATTSRDNSIEDSRANAQQQREALKTELQNEIADTREANRAKLEDLRVRLASELEEQRIKNQRDLEEQILTEQRKEEDRLTRNARELADFETKQARKLEALQNSLKAEFDLIAAAETAKTSLIVSEEEKRQKARETKRKKLQSAFVQANNKGIGSIDSSNTRINNTASLPVFGNGGRPVPGQPAIVGDRGPELFIPDTAGTIIPNHQLFSPPSLPQLSGLNNSNNTTNNNSNAFQLSPSMLDDPIQRRQLEAFVLKVMS